MLLNSNFRYIEQIPKSLEFALRKSYVLCCLIRTPIIRTISSVHRPKYGDKNEEKLIFLIFILMTIFNLLLGEEVLKGRKFGGNKIWRN